MSPKANLFLVGAAKGGTTALAKWLSDQPGVFAPAIKEPSFFGSDIKPAEFSEEYRKTYELPKGYFESNPLENVHMAYLRDPLQYEQLYKDAKQEDMRLDASTAYLLSSEAACEIYAYNPNAKIIAILRDPANRAYSHYLMAVQMGMISTSFEAAWADDLKAQPKGIGKSQMLSELGMYGASLKRYYDVFPKDQICVLLHEDFNQMTPEFVSRLERFTGLSLAEKPVSRENISAETRYKNLNKWIKNNSAFATAKQVLSPNVVKKVKRWMTQEVTPLSSEMRRELMDFYRSDIEETEALTGLDLKMWKN